MFEQYVRGIQAIIARGSDQEATATSLFQSLLLSFQPDLALSLLKQNDAFLLPHWQIKQQTQLVGYIETVSSPIELFAQDQIPAFQRIQMTFDNLLLTNFQEFRLYRHGELLLQTAISVSLFGTLEDEVTTTAQQLETLLTEFLHFRLQSILSIDDLALETAKRTRFLSECIQSHLTEAEKSTDSITSIYQTLQADINSSLTKRQFADQYAQALVLYSIQPPAFATIHPTMDQQNPPIATWWPTVENSFQNSSFQPVQIVRDEINQLLEGNTLLAWWAKTHTACSTANPILNFYKAFRLYFDPTLLYRRGIDKTAYPLANYVARAVNQLLKTQLSCQNGLADERVRVIHPASSFCTLMIEMMKLAAKTHIDQYGIRGRSQLFENHIHPHFTALEHRLDVFAWGALNAYFTATSTSFVASDQPFRHLFSPYLFQEKSALVDISLFPESKNITPFVPKPLPIIICNTFQLQDTPILNRQISAFIQESQLDMPSFSEIEGKRFSFLHSVSLRNPVTATIRIVQATMVQQGQGISALIISPKLLYHPDYRGVRASLMQTMNEIYILNLHGSSLHDENVPDGSRDENVFDDKQGVAVLFLVKRKDQTDCKVYNADLFGARRVKDDWLKHTEFELYNYQPIKPEAPRFAFSPYDLYGKQSWKSWKSLTEIMPLYQSVPNINESAWIDHDKTQLIRRLLNNQKKNTYAERFDSLTPTEQSVLPFEKEIIPFSPKPFEQQFIYLPASEEYRQIAQNFLHPNVALIISQSFSRGKGEMTFSCFLTTHLIAHPFLSTRPSEDEYLFPLSLFVSSESEREQTRQPMLSLFEPEEFYVQSSYNIDKTVLKQLAIGYGKKVDAETLFHYLYAILWSNHYRHIAAQNQMNSLPRIPFPMDRLLFDQLALKGQQLIELHTQQLFLNHNDKMPQYHAITDNQRIETSYFDEKEGRVYINADNYFEPITASQWQFSVGDHRILSQTLSRKSTMDAAIETRFCSLATNIADTLNLNEQIDNLFDEAIINTLSFM